MSDKRVDAAYWREKWEKNEIGFHDREVNPALPACWPDTAPGRVFVPLCGKSLDMLWLAERGWQVVGCELADVAARDFFAEAGLEPVHDVREHSTVYEAGSVAIHVGDIFSIDWSSEPPFDALYDRAALVALPPAERVRYARLIAGLMRPGAVGVVVTLDYDQAAMAGPPFAVGTVELERLYRYGERLRRLEVNDSALESNPKFAERGLTALTETVWSIEWPVKPGAAR